MKEYKTQQVFWTTACSVMDRIVQLVKSHQKKLLLFFGMEMVAHTGLLFQPGTQTYRASYIMLGHNELSECFRVCSR